MLRGIFMKNTKHNNMSVGEYEFKQLLEHIPYLAYWKDIKNDCFLACNKKLADFIGLTDPAQIIGLNGYDIAPNEFVALVREHEATAIATKQTIVVKKEIYHQMTGHTTIDITIGPILNTDNEVTSVVCYGSTIFMLANKSWHQVLELIKKENIHQLIKLSKYKVNIPDGTVILSKKEAECALFMLKGLKSKEIAREMEVAHRTVDNHIENIKNKLHCISRSQLTTALLNGGFIDNFA